MAAKRSSQYGMVMVMPFDLVAEVTCFFGRVIASSKAYRRIRSVPWRREHALLGDELAVGALEQPAADAGILALGVLAHDVEVDVRLGAAGERRAHARHQLAGPHVGHIGRSRAGSGSAGPRARHGPARPASRPRRGTRVVLASWSSPSAGIIAPVRL